MKFAGPTHVGMDRPLEVALLLAESRPHARGDGPPPIHPSRGFSQQAPRTWGWTVAAARRPGGGRAGPTHVGMDRPCQAVLAISGSRPHARGDGPVAGSPHRWVGWQAPRTWGWTRSGPPRPGWAVAGPTHVGMDRSRARTRSSRGTEPHARGDGPPRRIARIRPTPRAPRTWGWTACVGGSRSSPRAGPTHVGMDRARVSFIV